jgi:leucyl aminopeptidase
MDFSLKKEITVKQSLNCLVLPITGKKQHSKLVQKVDKELDGQITNFLAQGNLVFHIGKTAWLYPHNSTIKRILLVSVTNSADKKNNKGLSIVNFRNIINAVAQQLKFCPEKKAIFSLLDLAGCQDTVWQIQQAIKITNNAMYSFDILKSKPSHKPLLQQIEFIIPAADIAKAKVGLNNAIAIASGMKIAKDLGNTPGNICTPTYLADQAKVIAKTHKHMKCTVLDEKKLHSLKMETLLSVGHGSAEDSKLICLHFMNAGSKQPVTALVGKGVTFDTGGISIKPSAKMDEMKYDMCGAASVLGTMHAIAMLDLPVNVIAVVAAAENMPGSKATKPGDVVKSMSGKTVEILNTDAEGRLVLCDALTYVQKFNPKVIVDVATLTGACVVALGNHNSGMFSNDSKLANSLLEAAKQADDPTWQLPLGEEYMKLLDSSCADIANIGGPYGGSITAACFLESFIDNCKWAHLDIAGTAWVSGSKKHATGRPVPLLVQYLVNSI